LQGSGAFIQIRQDGGGVGAMLRYETPEPNGVGDVQANGGVEELAVGVAEVVSVHWFGAPLCGVERG
jgi:hypothetical protein